MIYSTDRLIVRKWEESDTKDLFEYCSDPEVTKYLTFPTYRSKDDALARIHAMHQAYEQYCAGHKDTNIDFAIELKSEGKVIGSVGFVGYKSDVLELGYVVNPKYQGQGYMTEALKGMLQYIRKHNLAKRIEAKFDSDNAASGKVMEKAGMKFLEIRSKAICNNTNKHTDAIVYSILCESI
jgi:ribosomal-protein-alanine N-acetyltransferase